MSAAADRPSAAVERIQRGLQRLQAQRLVFTGPSKLPPGFEAVVRFALYDLEPPAEVTTGGAPGVDALVHRLARELWPGVWRRVVIPAAPYDKAALAAEPPDELVVAPSGPEPYRLRNHRMLDFGDELVAFLWSAQFYRSGEWMTVNIARRRSIPVHEFLLGKEQP